MKVKPRKLKVSGFPSHAERVDLPHNLVSCAVTEVLLTFFFVLVIPGATSAGAPAGFAPLAIGLTLTLIVLIAIPVTNASVNPARSAGPAIFAWQSLRRSALVLLARVGLGCQSGRNPR
jgi:aquaporin Z